MSRTQQEVLEDIAKKINVSETINGKIVDDHVILDLPPEQRHYWSPQLNFRVETSEDDHSMTIIRGLVGPRPTVWGLFVFIYSAIGILGLFGTLYGLSKYSLGEYTHFVLALPIAILIMLTAYLTSKYGERLGQEQVEILKHFVRDALDLQPGNEE